MTSVNEGIDCEPVDDEELDPRIQMELEKLNAATDGINHLETEFGEAQALFQQMMQDATFHLKSLNEQLGKSVDKSRPYYEALKQSKISHNQLHDAALKFEQAQSRHFNAKKRVTEAEKRSLTVSGKLDPALQEMLNQATIEVMEASSASQQAWEIHRAASIEFEQKQKALQVLFKKLQKNIQKSRPYFDLKFNLNKQLEIQKKRLEKIQEGISISKAAYSETLRNLEAISDDIHKKRQEKRRSMLLEPRGEGVGADSEEESITHSSTMEQIRKISLDNIMAYTDDAESTDSELSSIDDNLLQSDIELIKQNSQINVSPPAIFISESQKPNDRPETPGSSTSVEENECSIGDETEKAIKETIEKIDASYEVITSHSLDNMPHAHNLEIILPEWDITDSGQKLLSKWNTKRARSFDDLSSIEKLKVKDISEKKCESEDDIRFVQARQRCSTMPKQQRPWGSFGAQSGVQGSNRSDVSTPESIQRAILRVAELTVPSLISNDDFDHDNNSDDDS